jgi:hypothetical protein
MVDARNITILFQEIRLVVSFIQFCNVRSITASVFCSFRGILVGIFQESGIVLNRLVSCYALFGKETGVIIE